MLLRIHISLEKPLKHVDEKNITIMTGQQCLEQHEYVCHFACYWGLQPCIPLSLYQPMSEDSSSRTCGSEEAACGKGGGFVVTNCSQMVVFRVGGCGVLGTKGELVLRDGNGDALLLIRGKEPRSCLAKHDAIRISTEPKGSSGEEWDYEIRGCFPDRDCSIIDSVGNVVAQIGVKKEVEELMANKDLYHVAVKPGMDQASVFGVIGVLDYIHVESTRSL
ncbi:aldehyde dehydrogenase family 7 member A1-like [Hibiscus syriacus]|uniref:Aldehyde dehydrogenase family 7 member A1-like n=1 Tax=Hibiscus syriacus TaxID=106335 RepID=A0A6A2YU75_HIBSY|nr:aldehyde dehydrogenase family 7 member A1-like [Hibiscus syriacus]